MLPRYTIEAPLPVRPQVLASLERARGATLSIALLERPGRPPILSLMFIRGDGSVSVRLEFKTDDDLDTLERAVAATRAAATLQRGARRSATQEK